MPEEQYQQALGDLSGSFSGIGAEMAVRNLDDPADLEACDQFSDTCVLVVVAPLAGTPAEAAGIQAGDVVLAVDGNSVSGSTMTPSCTCGATDANVTVLSPLWKEGRGERRCTRLLVAASEHPSVAAGGRFPAEMRESASEPS